MPLIQSFLNNYNYLSLFKKLNFVLNKKLFTLTIIFLGFILVTQAQETTVFYQSNSVLATSKDNAKFYVVYEPSSNGLVAYKKFSIDKLY